MKFYINVGSLIINIYPIGSIFNTIRKLIILLNFYKVKYNIDELEKFLNDVNNLYQFRNIAEYFSNLLRFIGVNENSKEYIDILLIINPKNDDSNTNYIIENLPDDVFEELAECEKTEIYIMELSQFSVDENYEYVIDVDVINFFYEVIFRMVINSIIKRVKDNMTIDLSTYIPLDNNNKEILRLCNNIGLPNLISDLLVLLQINGIKCNLEERNDITEIILDI